MNDQTAAVARKMSSLPAAAARHFATHHLSLGDDVELVVLLEQPDDEGSIVGAVVGASPTHIYIQPDDEDEDERAVAWVRIKLVVIRQKHEARLDGAERMVILVDGAEAGRGAQGTLQYAFYADDPEQEHFVVKRMTGDPQILDHLAATALDFVQHKHRHLIQYMAVRRVTPNELWILMPVVPGVNLEQLLARRQYEVRPPFDEVTVCSIVYQLTDALHFMHNNYVPRIHQDVKLSNVMIAEGEVVTLIDVDVSRIVNTRPERPEGTFDHMAPEALDSRPTCASDIFGLGCILFALLTNPEDLMLSHPQHGDLTLNSSLWTPATLEAALRRATLRWDYSVKMIDTLVLMLAHDESKRPTADMLRITFSELTASLLGVAEE